jgi:hypothetical protein
MDLINERTTAYVRVDFTDASGIGAVPATVTYSTKCKTTGTAIKTNVAVTPAASVTITLDALDNAIQNSASQSEEKLLTVRATYGTNDENNAEYRWRVKNLSGV